MALVLKDRVKVTSTTTGNGTFTLDSASTGYQDFSVIGDGNTTYYCIAGQGTSEWEVGIGTYTSSGTTLSRDTVLSSSAGGTNKVVFSSGTKEVFVTYPSEKGVWLDAAGDVVQYNFASLSVTGTATISNAALTTGTVSTTPASSTDIANKQYVDTLVSSGITYHTPVKYEVPLINLNATYNQPGGAGVGVGATLTNAGTQIAFTPDGVVASVGDRVLVYNQTNAYENGVYTVTTVGSGSTNWVLTRATDADTYGLKSPTALGLGDAFFVSSGNTGAGETYVCNTSGTITFGTTAITFAQVSDTQIYSAGTGLTLSGTQFSITNTAVTPASYGSASKTLTATVNAQGQLTSLADTNISIANSQITGLGTMSTQNANAVAITGGTIETTQLQAYSETCTTVGTVSASTYNINLALSNIFDITLGNDVTFTFTNPPSAGIAKNCTIILRQDGSGNRLATFTNAKYTDGTAPILSTGANQIDVLTFFTVNGGSFWFGTYAMANVS